MLIAVQTTIPAGFAFAGLDLKVNFLRPVFPDASELTARAEVVHPGRLAQRAADPVGEGDPGRHLPGALAAAHTQPRRGEGVVGAQPTLKPGQHFEYTSGCVLRTPRGTMHGTYRMHRDDGTFFDATIAPFDLLLPMTLN